MRDVIAQSSSTVSEKPSSSGSSGRFPPLLHNHQHHHHHNIHRLGNPQQQQQQHPGSSSSSSAAEAAAGRGSSSERCSVLLLGSSPTSTGGASGAAVLTRSDSPRRTSPQLDPDSFPAHAPRGLGMERVKARNNNNNKKSSASSSSSSTTSTDTDAIAPATSPRDSPDSSSSSHHPHTHSHSHRHPHPRHHNLCEKREKMATNQTKSKAKRKQAPPLPVLHPDVARGASVTVTTASGGSLDLGEEEEEDWECCGDEFGSGGLPGGGGGDSGCGPSGTTVFRFNEDSRPMFSPIPANTSSDTDGDCDSPRPLPCSRSTKPEKTVFPAIHVEKCERTQPSYAASCSPEPAACLSPESDAECDNEVMTTSQSSGGLNVPSPYLHRNSDGRIVIVTQDSNRGLLTSWSRSEGNLPEAIRRSHSTPGSQNHLLDIKYRPDWYPRPTLRQSSEMALHELRRRDGQRSPASPRRLAARLEPLDLNQRSVSSDKLQAP